MLKLYHYWSSVCSQKVRLCLAEKGIEWESVHIDLFTFDHWEADYVALNPKAVVPTLDHDGQVVIESNVIIEYLEEAFPETPLMPDDLHARSVARLWMYDSEEVAHSGVAVASFNVRHRPRMAKFSHAELEAINARNPLPGKQAQFMNRMANGIAQADVDAAYARLDALLDKMEAALADGPWLLGGDYSLADVALAPYVNRIEVLERPEMLSEGMRPRLAGWWRAVQDRPAFAEAFSFANPDTADPIKR